MCKDYDSLIDLPRLDGALEVFDDLPRPNWNVIRAWVAQHTPAPRHAAALDEAACQWLEALAEHLGPSYWVGCAPRSLLLTCQPRKDGLSLLRQIEDVRQTLDPTLGHLGDTPASERVAVLLFETADLYYTYICHFYHDGRFGASAGMCFTDGYPHIALFEGHYALPCLAHELAHACLTKLDLPTWLDEGIAQIMEHDLVGGYVRRLDHERADRHRSYWAKHGLQSFWTGDAFHSASEGQELAYELAAILVRNLIADHSELLPDFLRRARTRDSGQSTAEEVLGTALGTRAEGFLGPGSWEPVPRP